MWPEQAEAALSGNAQQASEGVAALFRDVIEPMADAFDPALCEPYAGLFARILERAVPGMRAAELVERYRRVRRTKRYGASGRGVRDVIVLSRVTLGADVAVASVMLDAAKKRFPEARIHFAGPGRTTRCSRRTGGFGIWTFPTIAVACCARGLKRVWRSAMCCGAGAAW